MLLFLTPLWLVIRGGFFVDGEFTLKYLFGVFQNPIYAEGLFNSLKLAVGTTAIVTLIAVPLAWMSNRYDFAGKSVLSGLVLVPDDSASVRGGDRVPADPRAVRHAERAARDRLRLAGTGQYFGVILLQALALYPIMYLNAAAALANVDPAMEEAAENLGCTGVRKFLRITLPLIMPGLFAGGTIVFIWSFTELGTPLIMNYHRCAPVQVFDALKEIGTNPFPYSLVFVMLATSVALYLISKLLFGREAYAMQSKAATASVAKRAVGWRAVVVPCCSACVILVALTPHFGVVATSFGAREVGTAAVLPQELTTANYVEALGHAMTVSSIRNSLLYSSLAVVFNIVLGIAIALVVVRSYDSVSRNARCPGDAAAGRARTGDGVRLPGPQLATEQPAMGQGQSVLAESV